MIGDGYFWKKTLAATILFVLLVLISAGAFSVVAGIYLMMIHYPITIIFVAAFGLLGIFLLCAWFVWNE